MGIKYRPEIDGLRAIAVLAVVLFHAGIGEAGYVGVDVFFVISGYLITSILISEPKIDLLAFYARRVRRIFPVAAVVVLAVLAFSALLPFDARQEAAKSAGAALVFGANVFFEFTTGGYWDSASDEMPLLHLWSLSVEEQFYFLWPALLIFTRSRKAIAVLALVSFGLAEYWMATNPEAAFFRMPARFWELAVGGLIAMAPRMPLPRIVGPVGVAVTLGACVIYIPHFPASGALLPVLGASMVIAHVHGGGTNRLLASRPMVGVGLVSYSLYLWHWPLLAFYKVYGGDSLAIRLALCLLALVLAALSYRFVEQPFRRMRFRSGRTVAVGATLSAVMALSACAIGLKDPPPRDTSNDGIAYQIEHDRMPHDCEYSPGDKVPKCPDPAGAKVAIWGDSMALAWRAGLPTATLQYTMHGCPPFVGFETRNGGCVDFNNAASVRVQKADVVYLVANWREYQDWNLTRTLDALKGKRVVIIGPSPRMQHVVPSCLRLGIPCAVLRVDFDRVAKPLLARIRAQAKPYPNVEVRDVTDDFCTAVECPPIRDGVGLYWDTHHISMTQARNALR